MICVNKIENRITFKTKAGYYVELLTTEAMQKNYLEVLKVRWNGKNENGENVPHSEITEVVLIIVSISKVVLTL